MASNNNSDPYSSVPFSLPPSINFSLPPPNLNSAASSKTPDILPVTSLPPPPVPPLVPPPFLPLALGEQITNPNENGQRLIKPKDVLGCGVNTYPSSPFAFPDTSSIPLIDSFLALQEKKKSAEEYILKKNYSQPNKQERRQVKQKLNISTIKELTGNFHKTLCELDQLCGLLEAGKKTMSQEDWEPRESQVEEKTSELSDISAVFRNDCIAFIEGVVKKRRQKREKLKLKRKEWQKRKKENLEFREKEHQRIDRWLEKMKLEAERIQREENVKKEADLVLSDVTLKKAEAKRTISLLNTLTKLRNARVHQKTEARKYVSVEETKSFTEIIEKLKLLWIDQLKEYNEEEHGLRVMLDEAEVERKNTELAELKKNLQNWNLVLFGQKTEKLTKSLQQNSFDDLICLRASWDQFVSVDGTIMASSIPVGWVKPSAPSSSEWAKYLKK